MSVENVGALTPTGSTKTQLQLTQCESYNTHLNIGTGNPCAGHRRAKLRFKERKNNPLLLSEENAGPFAPTGSRLQIRIAQM